MKGQFKVGEVCIGQNFLPPLEYNGMECVIVEALAVVDCYCAVTGDVLPAEPRYCVQWSNGKVWAVKPMYLRRKQPPAGEQSILRMFTAPSPREVEAA